MGGVIPVIYLVFITTVTLLSSASSEHSKASPQKSKLMLEYNWPEPTKNLKRFPHPESCFHFYLTRPDGSHAIKSCHGGEIFDYQTLRCKEKSSAKCWKDIVKKGNMKKMRRHFSCPFPWGLYPNTDDCSQFYDCLGGKSYLRKCPASTLFDKVERTCVPTGKAMCADHSDVVEPGYRCLYKWGFYTHPRDCSKYYECLRKIPSIRTCEKNMLFDNFRRSCMPMDTVKCGARLNPYENKKLSTEADRLKETPISPDDIPMESTLARLNHISQESIKSSPDEIALETTPARVSHTSQVNIKSSSDEVALETTPARVNHTSKENIKSSSDEIVLETSPASPHKDAQKTIVAKSDNDAQKKMPVRTESITLENKTKPDNEELEIIMVKSGEDIQEKTEMNTHKVAPKNTQAYPDEVQKKLILTAPNNGTRETPPKRPDREQKIKSYTSKIR